jgi:hypothetical protein
VAQYGNQAARSTLYIVLVDTLRAFHIANELDRAAYCFVQLVTECELKEDVGLEQQARVDAQRMKLTFAHWIEGLSCI